MMNNRAPLACLAVTAGLLAGSITVGVTTAEASSSNARPTWAQRSDSIGRSPDSIVRNTPKGKALNVVVTRETSHGPEITTTPVGSTGAARSLVRKAQQSGSTIAVGMAQSVEPEGILDPLLSQQWALKTLAASTIWSLTQGNGVTVAVVDTGVNGRHPDLGGRVLAGYNVVSNANAGNTDSNGHGTHVAGIIAATANNGIGVAGLAPQTQILPVKVVDSKGASNTGYLAEGIVWATNHGAKVINVSMGGSTADPNLNSAVQYAWSKNVVIAAAAGNEKQSGNKKHYPAAFSNVLGVGAVDSSWRVASFSNTGSYVDVVAPGVKIESTYTSPSYALMTGTSMATPYVAATAALTVARAGSGYTAKDVVRDILSSARDIGSGGWDTSSGYGMVQPLSAVTMAGGGTVAATSPNSLRSTGRVTVSPTGTGTVNVSCTRACSGWARVWSNASGSAKSETIYYKLNGAGWKPLRFKHIPYVDSTTAKVRFAIQGPYEDGGPQFNSLRLVRSSGNVVKTTSWTKVSSAGKARVNVSCTMKCSGWIQLWSDTSGTRKSANVVYYSLAGAGWKALYFGGVPNTSASWKARVAVRAPAPTATLFNPLTLVRG